MIKEIFHEIFVEHKNNLIFGVEGLAFWRMSKNTFLVSAHPPSKICKNLPPTEIEILTVFCKSCLGAGGGKHLWKIAVFFNNIQIYIFFLFFFSVFSSSLLSSSSSCTITLCTIHYSDEWSVMGWDWCNSKIPITKDPI